MLTPEVEARPWAEQLELDDVSYRTQLAYLFERSAFYREKLTAAGVADAPAAGVLEETGRREVAEEVGLDLTGVPLTYLESEYFVTDRGEHQVTLTFLAPAPPGQPGSSKLRSGLCSCGSRRRSMAGCWPRCCAR